MANGKPRIAFIGFGEAGQAIAAGLHDADAAMMAAWDILFPQGVGNKLRRGAFAGIRRGGRPPLASSRALQYSHVLVTTFGIAPNVPANLISPRCSGRAAPSASARS